MRIQGLSLAGIASADITKKMLPTMRENTETLPGVRVVPSQTPETSKRASFEQQRFRRYYADIVIIAASNSDYVTRLDYLTHRAAIVGAFEELGSGLPAEVWKTEVIPGVPLDRKRLSQNYFYSEMTVAFDCLINN